MPRDLPTGIFKIRTGYRVFVRLSRDRLETATFPPGTTLPEMKQWRETIRADFKRLQTAPAAALSQGFAKDAATYLQAVAGMPSFLDRQRDIQWWVSVFEERPRAQIQSHEIAAALATSTLSASSLNHRRTALAHLWRVLDGRTAGNPVRDVPRRREPDPAPRGLSYATIRKIFAAMRDSKMKACLMVMAWTGIPPAQIKTITRADIDLQKRSVYVRGRAKGKGTKGRQMRLTPDGIAAFKTFIRCEAFGWFARSSMREAFTIACRKVERETAGTKHPIDLTGARPYDLRHSFGTALYAASGDIRATQILMGHAKAEMTHRYTLGAVEEQVGKALAAFARRTRRKVTR